ncbi:hypothetical protein RDV78_07240 [Bacillota bacterium LX-D]|nr:hypothetical protein [Bacillota bacterium LX-D]
MAPREDKRSSKGRRIALSGILASFVLLSLYLASLLPTNKLFFYGLSSVFSAIMILEFGASAGWFFYLGTGLLAAVFLPDKFKVFPYIVFLGHYGIWKWYIESLRNLYLEIILKSCVFNLALLGTYYLAKELLWAEVPIKIDLRWLWLAWQGIFFVYDYALTVVINFYQKRIKPLV